MGCGGRPPELDPEDRACGAPAPEPQAAGEVRDSAVRLKHLHARREVLQEAAQPLQEFGIVARREVEADLEDALFAHGDQPALP